MKDGMDNNVFVKVDIIELKMLAEHVMQILIIMDKIVFVIMDFMETQINVTNAIKLVENVQDQVHHNV